MTVATRSRVLRAGIAQATPGYAITGLGACIVLLARDLAVAPQRLAWLPATFGAGLLVVAATGPVLLRGGPGRALVGGSLVLATGVTVLALAPALPLAVLGALLLGVGGAAFVLVTPALLAGPEAAVQLSRVVGVSSAAAVLAPGAIGALDASGVVGGRLALLVAVPPLLFLAWNAREPEPPPPPLPAARPAAGPVARRWIVVVLAVSVEFCFTIWAVARLADSGLTPSRAAVFGTAFPIGMAVGRLAAPRGPRPHPGGADRRGGHGRGRRRRGRRRPPGRRDRGPAGGGGRHRHALPGDTRRPDRHSGPQRRSRRVAGSTGLGYGDPGGPGGAGPGGGRYRPAPRVPDHSAAPGPFAGI
ncbi:hypothetical protein [Pseudosporangium ferrugineum]|uniref:hypothetical protein n=1 Tax=Pseudosporangium ferrugineum TaxID=439699 RepID=UPI000D05C320|nr:hypothetical protein [Pseudosporangium ferrugineum]